MKLHNQITLNDAKLAMDKRFIAVNDGGADLITEANINAINVGPLTYLVPEAVDILTAPLTFDRLAGESSAIREGYFGQDTITIRFNEKTGVPAPYVAGSLMGPGGNFADVNYSGISVGVAYRELWWEVDYKTIASSGLMNFDIVADKVKAVLNAMAIDRNKINFEGIAETAGGLPVYGLLNFPGLSDYQELPQGASGSTKWADKTAEEIFNDINFMINQLSIQSSGLSREGFARGETYKIGVSLDVYGYLTKTNSYGLMALEKIKAAYGNKIEIVGVPEMNNYAGSTTKKKNGENMAIVSINAGDGVSTYKSSYIELARFFEINRMGSVMGQKIVSALSGCIVNRPVLVAKFKGL